MELSLGCGVRGGAVGLGGGRPRFCVWSGLLFLMEKHGCGNEWEWSELKYVAGRGQWVRCRRGCDA